MLCPSCAKEITDDSNFCRFCGIRLGRPATSSEVTLYTHPRLIPGELLRDDERLVFEKNPKIPVFLLRIDFLVILLLVFGDAVYFKMSVLHALYLSGIVALLIVLTAYLISKRTAMALTNWRVIKVKGFFKKEITELPLQRIEEIKVKTNILQKGFNCGYIMFTTSGTQGVQFKWENIDDPKTIRDTITKLMPKKD